MQDKKLDDMTKKYKEEMMRLYSKNRTGHPPQPPQSVQPMTPASKSPSASVQSSTAPVRSEKTVNDGRDTRAVRSFDVSPRTMFKEANTEDNVRDLSNPPMPDIPKNYSVNGTAKTAQNPPQPPMKPTKQTQPAPSAQSEQQLRQAQQSQRADTAQKNIASEMSDMAEVRKKSKFPPAEEILKSETEGETVTAMAAKADRKPPAVTHPAVTRIAPEEEHYQGNYDFSPLPGASEDNDTPETDMQGEIQPDISYPNESSDFSSVDTGDVFPEDNPRDMSGQGYLQVEVTAASRAIPVQDATVIVTESSGEMDSLIGMTVTDENGSTPVMPLPAPSKSFSESPDPSERPYSEYNIRVYKQGFYTVPQLTVPIFDGIKSIQPVSMIPLAEFERNGTEEPNASR